jgi:hypothetical protein
MNIPAGATPKAIQVQLPGIDGATVWAWWPGSPGLNTGNFVAVQKRNQGGAQYVITGASGGTASAPATHTILSSTHSDSLADTIVAGDILYGNNTPRLARLPRGSNGQVLTLSSGLPAWINPSGGVQNNFSATAAPTVNDDSGDGYSIGSMWIDITNQNIYQAEDVSVGAANWIWLNDTQWPFTKILTVSATDPSADFTTVGLAISNASAGDLIWLDPGTYTETLTINTALSIYGPGATITSADAATITINAACTFYHLTIANTNAGALARPIAIDASTLTLVHCTLSKTSGAATVSAGISSEGAATLNLVNSYINITAGTTRRGVFNDVDPVTLTIDGGAITASTNTIYDTYDGSTVTLRNNPMLAGGAPSFGGATTTLIGHYTDSSGVLTPLTASGISGGIWLHRAGGARIKYATIAAAITASANGDTIKLYTGTYDLGSTGLVVNKSITIVGDGPEVTLITCSESGNPTIDITTGSVMLKDLWVANTSAGTTAGAVATDSSGIVLENCYLHKTSGTPTNSYGFYLYGGGSARLTNCRIAVETGTNRRGIMNDTAAGTITVEGGEVGGVSFDLYSNQSSTITLSNCILTNATYSWSGTIQGEALDVYGRKLRVKPAGLFNGRMTLTTATPVPTADQTAKTTIYLTPIQGGEIEVYNGYFWIEAKLVEISLSLSGFTADKNSDLWVYDNAGTLALERTEWTNDTTRATAIAFQDGRYVKSGTVTRLYCGSFRTTGTTGQTEDSLLKRFIWNYYNRRIRPLQIYDTNSHTYNTASWRSWNNDDTVRLHLLNGVDDQPIAVSGSIEARSGTGAQIYGGVGLDTTTAGSIQEYSHVLTSLLRCGYAANISTGDGYHYLQQVEFGHTGTAPTFSRAGLFAAIFG